MSFLSPLGITRARLAILLLGSLLHRLAAEPALARETQNDIETNLKKSLAGYKVGDPARYTDVFSPLRTQKAALSPDGRHLAYTVRTDNEIYLHIVAVDQPAVLKTRIKMREFEDIPELTWDFASQMVDFLCWVSNSRLVFAGNGSRFVGGGIAALNADGSDARVLATTGDFREIANARATGVGSLRVIGLHPDRADSVIFTVEASANRGPRALPATARRVRVTRALNVLTGEMATLSDMMTRRSDLVMFDDIGRPCITVDLYRTGRADVTRDITYQTTPEPDGAPTLDEVTGLNGFTFSPTTLLGEGSVPLGFGARGNILYYASNVGRNTYGIYAFDLKTKQRLPGTMESSTRDLLSPQLGTYSAADFFNYQNSDRGDREWGHLWRVSPQLVPDRFTHQLAGVRYEGSTRTALWLRPELQAVQAYLATHRPGRSAEILEWDESLNRFLILEQGPADAGAFFVLDRSRATYTQFTARGPEPEAGSIAQLRPFAFTLPDGSKLDGQLALPKDSKVKRIPLVLFCPDLPWQRRGASYQPEFEALTRMGFAVAIYNGRGAWGTGIEERQKLQGDYIATQVADLVAVADHLADNFDVSRRGVALYGQGHGGYVALRALQECPGRFRCAVTVEAHIHGNALFDAVVHAQPVQGSLTDASLNADTPLITEPQRIKAPVFTIVEFSESPRYHANTALHRAVKRAAPDSELLIHYKRDEPKAMILARQWARTESFLNYVLYNFSVKIGELEVLPEEAAKEKQP